MLSPSHAANDVEASVPQSSAAILCRLRELRGEADPVYRHYASKVAAGEVLVPNGKLTFEDWGAMEGRALECQRRDRDDARSQ
jgi:hypothetical protein